LAIPKVANAVDKNMQESQNAKNSRKRQIAKTTSREA
jgi:hypothetical protein